MEKGVQSPPNEVLYLNNKELSILLYTYPKNSIQTSITKRILFE